MELFNKKTVPSEVETVPSTPLKTASGPGEMMAALHAQNLQIEQALARSVELRRTTRTSNLENVEEKIAALVGIIADLKQTKEQISVFHDEHALSTNEDSSADYVHMLVCLRGL